jgi:hypothetical protein
LTFGDGQPTGADLLRQKPTQEVLGTLKKLSGAFGEVNAANQLADAGKEATPAQDGAIAQLKAWEIPGEIAKVFTKIDDRGDRGDRGDRKIDDNGNAKDHAKDRGKDTKIDLDELGRAVQDPAYTGRAAQALAALYAARRELAGAGKARARPS